ncbi:hypothetical protein [Streptomyces sp. H27-C3]|uniref:hypothetical protein n=1 Tax=Streptomyces sp. H27-C3 TaxID=3046305 RepID=UPI0024BAD319|nr:hypothetical protein [Streptomyces sp. H27-C3]MDJ0465097.1 hypothetical protein [Streptomyces sp. H27-C3]
MRKALKPLVSGGEGPEVALAEGEDPVGSVPVGQDHADGIREVEPKRFVLLPHFVRCREVSRVQGGESVLTVHKALVDGFHDAERLRKPEVAWARWSSSVTTGGEIASVSCAMTRTALSCSDWAASKAAKTAEVSATMINAEPPSP